MLYKLEKRYNLDNSLLLLFLILPIFIFNLLNFKNKINKFKNALGPADDLICSVSYKFKLTLKFSGILAFDSTVKCKECNISIFWYLMNLRKSVIQNLQKIIFKIALVLNKWLFI